MCLHTRLSRGWQPGGTIGRLRQDLRVPEQRRSLRGELLHAELPCGRERGRKVRWMRGHVLVSDGRDDVHGKLLHAQLSYGRQPRWTIGRLRQELWVPE